MDTDMDKAVMGISYKVGNAYLIIINNLHKDLKKELIDYTVDLNAKFYFEDKELGILLLKI